MINCGVSVAVSDTVAPLQEEATVLVVVEGTGVVVIPRGISVYRYITSLSIKVPQ